MEEAPGDDVRVQGVACLSTPFLIHAERKPSRAQFVALGAGPFIAALLLALRLPRDVDGLLRPGPVLTTCVAGVVLGMIAMHWAPVLAESAKRTLLGPESLEKALADRLFIIRSRGDEAAAGLGIGYIIGRAIRWLWLWVYQHVSEPFARVYNALHARRAVFSLQWMTVATIAIIVLPFQFVTEYQGWLIAIWAELPVVIVVFIVLVLLLWVCILGHSVVGPGLEVMFYVPLNLLLGVFAMPFAPELIVFSPYLDISAEPTPVGGPYRVLAFAGRPGDLSPAGPGGLKPRGPGGLSHSTYNDEECRREIARWICKSHASCRSMEDNQHEGDRGRDVLPVQPA